MPSRPKPASLTSQEFPTAPADGSIDHLLPIIYEQIKSLARRRLAAERRGHTMGTTDLAHEVYLQLRQENPTQPLNQARIMAAAARETLRILVDHARKRGARKRGGGGDRQRVTITGLELVDKKATSAVDVLAFDEALQRLAALSERAAQVVTLRFVGGMTVEQTAEALGLHPRTVADDWVTARAFLRRELAG